MRSRLSIGKEERVTVPRHVADLLQLQDGDPVDLHAVPGTFAVLEKAGREAPGPYLAGSLRSLSAPEVFHFLSNALKSGTLLLSFGHGQDAPLPDVPAGLRRKTVTFRDGQITFASSSERADRLGGVLYRSGMVPLEEIERCGRLVQAGRPLGQVLVEEGILDPGQLYAAMALQVREIVLGAFLDDEGEFAFVEGRGDDHNAVRLAERTRDLLLEGMRRRAAMELLADRLPDRESVARRSAGGTGDPGPQGRRLLEALDGQRTVRRALDDSWLGVFEGSRALAALLRDGWVEAESPRPSPARAAAAPAHPVPSGGPFEAYARIIRHVYEELSRVQRDAGHRLESFFERLPPARRAVFEGVRIGADGDIDVAQVLLNVGDGSARPGPAARARALDALESFLAFALFEVKNCLPPADAARVLERVARMQEGAT
ncbi:MAG TPA: DUF4388 domain-containing protein [Anaeromyxobacteraceae bacterium]|nr:DUF4388 domain-containing protein [Anaeromyxobacteraceae bacterium]